MADFKLMRIDELETIEGPGGMKIRRGRGGLGVEAFGANIFELPPNADTYPEHNHAESVAGMQPGQQEVYVVLRGSGEIEIEGERFPLDPEQIVRIDAGTTRKLYPGDEGMTVLALGGVPGQAYEPPG